MHRLRNQMPAMDGFEASRQIRSLGGALKKVGIVALRSNREVVER